MDEVKSKDEYEAKLDEQTGQLYNRFVVFIAESRVPLYHALVTLDVLRSEIIDQIKKTQGLI